MVNFYTRKRLLELLKTRDHQYIDRGVWVEVIKMAMRYADHLENEEIMKRDPVLLRPIEEEKPAEEKEAENAQP